MLNNEDKTEMMKHRRNNRKSTNYLNNRWCGVLCQSKQDADASAQMMPRTHSTDVSVQAAECQRMSSSCNGITWWLQPDKHSTLEQSNFDDFSVSPQLCSGSPAAASLLPFRPGDPAPMGANPWSPPLFYCRFKDQEFLCPLYFLVCLL